MDAPDVVRVAFKGTYGCHAETAAIDFVTQFCQTARVDTVPHRHVASMFDDIVDGSVQLAIFTTSLSAEGSDGDILRHILERRCYIVAEYEHEEHPCLIASRGTKLHQLTAVKTVQLDVKSDAQSDVCIDKDVLGEGVTIEPIYDIVHECNSLRQSRNGKVAIVGNHRLARLHRLDVIKHLRPRTPSTFVILANTQRIPYLALQTTRPSKMSVVYDLKDAPGSLFRSVAPFVLRGINVTHVECNARHSGGHVGGSRVGAGMPGSREEALRMLESSWKGASLNSENDVSVTSNRLSMATQDATDKAVCMLSFDGTAGLSLCADALRDLSEFCGRTRAFGPYPMAYRTSASGTCCRAAANLSRAVVEYANRSHLSPLHSDFKDSEESAENCTDFLSMLPEEVSRHILEMLCMDVRDIVAAARVCQRWQYLCSDGLLWRKCCQHAGLLSEPQTPWKWPALPPLSLRASVSRDAHDWSPRFDPRGCAIDHDLEPLGDWRGFYRRCVSDAESPLNCGAGNGHVLRRALMRTGHTSQYGCVSIGPSAVSGSRTVYGVTWIGEVHSYDALLAAPIGEGPCPALPRYGRTTGWGMCVGVGFAVVHDVSGASFLTIGSDGVIDSNTAISSMLIDGVVLSVAARGTAFAVVSDWEIACYEVLAEASAVSGRSPYVRLWATSLLDAFAVVDSFRFSVSLCGECVVVVEPSQSPCAFAWRDGHMLRRPAFLSGEAVDDVNPRSVASAPDGHLTAAAGSGGIVVTDDRGHVIWSSDVPSSRVMTNGSVVIALTLAAQVTIDISAKLHVHHAHTGHCVGSLTSLCEAFAWDGGRFVASIERSALVLFDCNPSTPRGST